MNHFFDPNDGLIHIPYIGRAGHDMRFSLNCIFHALKLGLVQNPQLFQKIRFYYIGTSYAANGMGKRTVEPIAQEAGVGEYVKEYTDRIPYFEALRLLKDASVLIIPGSDDPKYTASKLYNYILAHKPLLAVFNKKSSVITILEETHAGKAIGFDEESNMDTIGHQLYQELKLLLSSNYCLSTNWDVFEKYTAREMTKKQVMFFEKIIKLNAPVHPSWQAKHIY